MLSVYSVVDNFDSVCTVSCIPGDSNFTDQVPLLLPAEIQDKQLLTGCHTTKTRFLSEKICAHRRSIPWEYPLQEWEGPKLASPAAVSQSLEDIMLQRFPELEPLLLQSSFTNKQASWRGPKSGHTSHAPSRGHSLGVSREASFTHPR